VTGEWQRCVEIEPCDELDLLNVLRPERDEPASVWVAWHERHVACWEQIAALAPFLADNAAYMVRGHRREIEELLADPHSRKARRGYWDLIPRLTEYWPDKT